MVSLAGLRRRNPIPSDRPHHPRALGCDPCQWHQIFSAIISLGLPRRMSVVVLA
jgi:hypothetical protein